MVEGGKLRLLSFILILQYVLAVFEPADSICCDECEEEFNANPSLRKNERNASVEAAIEETTRNLTLPKGQLGQQVRKLISASDPRPSSAYLGSTILIFLFMVLGLPLVIDILRLVTWLRAQYSSSTHAHAHMTGNVITADGVMCHSD